MKVPEGAPAVAMLMLAVLLATGSSLSAAEPVLALPATGSGLSTAEPAAVTLEQAVAATVKNSSGVRIARARVDEARARRQTARADFLPQLTADGTWMRRNDTELVTIPAGSLGNVPGLGPFPTQDASLGQGKNHLYLQNLTLGQPITQLVKIHHGYEAASAEERAAQAELRKMELDMAYKARQAYMGLLIGQARLTAAKAGAAAALAGYQDAQEAVQAGNALKVAQTGGRAQLLMCRQKEQAEEATIHDLAAELNDLMGRPTDSPLEAAPVVTEPRTLAEPAALLEEALKGNPDLARATAKLEQSRSGVRAGKADFIPDVSAFVRQTHQDGVPFVRNNYTTIGMNFSWSILDGGRKAYVVSQRNALASQANEDHDRLRRRVEIDLGKTLRKVETARLMVDAAAEASSLNVEKARLAAEQRKAGTISAARLAEAEAAARAAEADLLASRLALELDYAELDQLLGKS